MASFGTLSRFSMVALVAGVVLTGCARSRPVIAPEAPIRVEEDRRALPETPTEVQPEVPMRPATYPEHGVAAGELPADLEELNRAGFLKDVFFETDKHDLTEEARNALAANAAWLRTHPTIRILVEGHCDERNTSEYNMALGWRRANSVKAYLVSLGISANRIETISFGKERPFVLGNNEWAWSQNRRGHCRIVGR